MMKMITSMVPFYLLLVRRQVRVAAPTRWNSQWQWLCFVHRRHCRWIMLLTVFTPTSLIERMLNHPITRVRRCCGTGDAEELRVDCLTQLRPAKAFASCHHRLRRHIILRRWRIARRLHHHTLLVRLDIILRR